MITKLLKHHTKKDLSVKKHNIPNGNEIINDPPIESNDKGLKEMDMLRKKPFKRRTKGRKGKRCIVGCTKVQYIGSVNSNFALLKD